FVRRSAQRQLGTVGAEGVRLEYLGAGAQIRSVQILDNLRMGQVQPLVARLADQAALAQHCAERAIADEHFVAQPRQKFFTAHAEIVQELPLVAKGGLLQTLSIDAST